MKNFFRLIGLCSFLFLLCGCGALSAGGFSTAYHARILDAETREPIEGAVGLVEWYENHFFLHNSTFLAASEGVSDKNGELVIPLPSLLESPDYESINVIKAGYSVGGWRPIGYKYPNSKLDKGKLEWEGKKPIVLLRKLTKEERRKLFMPSPPDEASYKDIRHFLHELRREDAEVLGGKRTILWKGVRYE